VKGWRVLETMDKGLSLEGVNPEDRVFARGEDYMVLLEVVRRRRVLRFTHLVTGEQKDLNDFEVVPSVWCDPELFHWLNKATAKPWTWAVIVRDQDWQGLVEAHERRMTDAAWKAME
jgi:hypothetical protein